MTDAPILESDAPRNQHGAEGWDGPNPSTSDDVVWWAWCGMCGGCGSDACHPGRSCSQQRCIDPMYGYSRLLCDRCPDRIAQGWWPS